MYQTSFQFQTNGNTSYLEKLAQDLKDMLEDDAKVYSGYTKDLTGEKTGTYSIWADVSSSKELYLAYGFLALHGGQK